VIAKSLGAFYVLHEPIGRGAMGQVWRGAVIADGSPVAIKVLHAELAEDADVVARFHREGSIMVAIRYPCVVGIRDVVTEGGTLAIVMDLIEGGDLGAYLRSAGSLPPSEALRLTGQVLAGLQAVHQAGILHHDLKPENIPIR
jgi:serine/threonine protein kinase